MTRFHKSKNLFVEPNLDHTDYRRNEEAWRKPEVNIDKVVDMRNEHMWDDFMAARGVVVQNSFA